MKVVIIGKEKISDVYADKYRKLMKYIKKQPVIREQSEQDSTKENDK